MLNSDHSHSTSSPTDVLVGGRQAVWSLSSILPCLATSSPCSCDLFSLAPLQTIVFLTSHFWHFLTVVNITSHLHDDLESSPLFSSVFPHHPSPYIFVSYFSLRPNSAQVELFPPGCAPCAAQSLWLGCPLSGNVLFHPSSYFFQCLKCKCTLSSFC